MSMKCKPNGKWPKKNEKLTVLIGVDGVFDSRDCLLEGEDGTIYFGNENTFIPLSATQTDPYYAADLSAEDTARMMELLANRPGPRSLSENGWKLAKSEWVADLPNRGSLVLFPDDDLILVNDMDLQMENIIKLSEWFQEHCGFTTF
jgi:hypothetical protein